MMMMQQCLLCNHVFSMAERECPRCHDRKDVGKIQFEDAEEGGKEGAQRRYMYVEEDVAGAAGELDGTAAAVASAASKVELSHAIAGVDCGGKHQIGNCDSQRGKACSTLLTIAAHE